MRITRGLWSVALLALGIFAAWSLLHRRAGNLRAAQSRGRVALESCSLPNVEGKALCGVYEVFENRATKTGRKIGLKIVVLPALGDTPAPDPVFWLAGGPGQAATQTIGMARNGVLAGVRKKREIIFVDQRGTGKSNELMCDIADDPQDLPRFFGELFPPDRVQACRESLEKIADLTLYTTPIAMDDLDELREALGYDKINVAGASYGTFAAQVYMRLHPQHIRTVFLGGVTSPAIRQPLLFPQAAQNALDSLYADCAADDVCSKTFPDFKKEFAAVLGRFEKGPVAAELFNPTTKQKETVHLAREGFVERVRLLLYTTNSARFVPVVIHHAFQNDYLPFEGLGVRSNPGGGIARGMYLTVTCSEGVPFITEKQIVEAGKGTFLGEARVREHIEACKLWPRGKIESNYVDLVSSDAPVLMISGEADGAVPPSYGEAALRNFPNGRQVKIAHYGHQLDGPCVKQLFEAFIEKGSSKDLDTRCTAQVRRPAFATEVPPQVLPR